MKYLEKTMEKLLKRLRIASISLAVIGACGLVYNLILFAILRPRVLNFEALGEQMDTLNILGILSGVSLALIGFFHLFTVITLLLQVTAQRSASMLKILTIVVGVISGLLLLSDLAMLQDIGKQYVAGLGTAAEWTILFINHGLHLLFTVLALITLATRSKRESLPPETAVKDDVLFAAAHTTGALCGGIGLTTILLALLTRLPIQVIEVISFPVSLLVLLPYLLMLGAWLFMKRRERMKDWLDEKQFQDTARAGLWTLLLLLPCLTAFGILQRVNGSGNVYDFIWFPFTIFLGMLAFSSVVLHSIRR
jgi:hypothetical protein